MGALRQSALCIALGLPLLTVSFADAAPPVTTQPLCPRLAPDAFAARLQAARILPSHHFGFGGVRFYRASGHVDCRLVREGGAAAPVCRFSRPVALQVSTASGRYDFFPVSGAATVTVRGGRASCVMAG